MPVQDYIDAYEQAQAQQEQEAQAASDALKVKGQQAMVAAMAALGLRDELEPVGKPDVSVKRGRVTVRIAHVNWSRALGNELPAVFLMYGEVSDSVVLRLRFPVVVVDFDVLLWSRGQLPANFDQQALGEALKKAQAHYLDVREKARDKRVYELSRKLREMPLEAKYQDEVVALEAKLNQLAPGRAATWAQLRQDWETRLAAAQAEAAAEAAARAQYLEEAKVFLRAAGAENRHVVGELDALQDQVDGTFGLHPLTYAVVARDAADVVAVGTEQMYVTADTPDADGYFTEVNYVNGLSTRVKVTNVVLIYDAETFQVADGNYVRRLTYARPDEPWAVRGLVYCRTADEATVLARFDELLARAWPVSPARPAELTPQQARAVVDQALQEVLAEDPTLVFDV